MHFFTFTRVLLRRSFRALPRPSRNVATVGLSGAVLLSGTFAFSSVGEPDLGRKQQETVESTSHISELLRSYVVYSLISIPLLVDKSTEIFSGLNSVPGLKQITERFVRITFFSQFVGGDSALGTLPVLQRLRGERKGAILAYSAEVSEAAATGKGLDHTSQLDRHTPARSIVDELIHCIDVSADFEDGKTVNAADRRTWVAVKITALLPDTLPLKNFSRLLLENRSQAHHSLPSPTTAEMTDISILGDSAPQMSLHSYLSREDMVSMKKLYSDLVKICTRAQERGVKILIDGEYSWYHPAIEAVTLSLMQRFNKLPYDVTPSSPSELEAIRPLIYGTFQAYLRETPQRLQSFLDHAQTHNYALGVKLVRGAYHPHEIAAHKVISPTSPDLLPPVWLAKTETDVCYDACARLLLAHVREDIERGKGPPTIGVVFATHNWMSCRTILDEMFKLKLVMRDGKEEDEAAVFRIDPDVAKRISFAQLYGMRDTLTNYIVERTVSSAPFVVKHVPYGSLSEALSYLSRRAIENKSILEGGPAREERQRAWDGIKKWFWGDR